MHDAATANRLDGKVMLVTGAGSGIGRATALLAVAYGAKVALIDYDEAAARTAAGEIGEAALALRADVSKAADVDRAVAQTVARFGKLDCVANIAGVHDLMTPVEEFDEAAWKRLFDINVLGVALVMRRALKEMLPRGSGSIVNMASTSAIQGGLGGAAYSTSKGAVVTLTRQVAHDVAERGVRVNSILSGPAMTNILTTARTVIPENRPGAMAEHFMGKAVADPVARIPMRRFGNADEIAQAVIFLSSDAASFITGVDLPVDGGQSVN